MTSRELPGRLDEGLRTIEEAMRFTRLSRSGVYALMASGQLPFVRLGRRRLIPAAALVQLVQQNLVGHPQSEGQPPTT